MAETPNPVPQCYAQTKLGPHSWTQCPLPAVGDLVYDKPGVNKDISWPYCKDHLSLFEKANKDLWIDLYGG